MAVTDFDYTFITKRAKNIILSPQREWKTVVSESTSAKNLVIFYALPLAGIAAIIQLLSIWLGTYLTFWVALKAAIIQLLLPIATIIASAILINELAQTFDSAKNITNAFKLIVYSYTPWLIANIIASISWSLSWVVIFGLYGIYLLWLGLPALMQTSDDKKPIYALATVIIVLFVQLILGALFNIGRLT